jgi:hypothetical protein
MAWVQVPLLSNFFNLLSPTKTDYLKFMRHEQCFWVVNMMLAYLRDYNWPLKQQQQLLSYTRGGTSGKGSEFWVNAKWIYMKYKHMPWRHLAPISGEPCSYHRVNSHSRRTRFSSNDLSPFAASPKIPSKVLRSSSSSNRKASKCADAANSEVSNVWDDERPTVSLWLQQN